MAIDLDTPTFSLRDIGPRYSKALKRAANTGSIKDFIANLNDFGDTLLEAKRRREEEDRAKQEQLEAEKRAEETRIRTEERAVERQKQAEMSAKAESQEAQAGAMRMSQEQEKMLDQLEDQFYSAPDDVTRQRALARIRRFNPDLANSMLKDYESFKPKEKEGEKEIDPETQEYIGFLRKQLEGGNIPASQEFAIRGLIASARANGVTKEEVELAMSLFQEEQAAKQGALSPTQAESAQGVVSRLTGQPQATNAPEGASPFSTGMTPGPVSVPENLVPGEAASLEGPNVVLNAFDAELKSRLAMWESEGRPERSKNNVFDPVVRSTIYREIEDRMSPKKKVSALESLLVPDKQEAKMEEIESFPIPDEPYEMRLQRTKMGLQSQGITGDDIRANPEWYRVRFDALGLDLNDVLEVMGARAVTP